MTKTKYQLDVSFQNTLFMSVFTILPFLLGLLTKELFTSNSVLYGKGEFFLYSVSLISSSILSYQSLSNFRSLLKGWPNMLAIVLLVLLAGTYAVVITNNESPDLTKMKLYSIIAFLIAVVLFFISQMHFNKAIATQRYKEANSDVHSQREEEQNDLMNGIK